MEDVVKRWCEEMMMTVVDGHGWMSQRERE